MPPAPYDARMHWLALAVGFQQVVVGSMSVAIWYPSDSPVAEQPIGPFRQTVASDGRLSGHDLPLIIISHGTGGSNISHYDVALALARAGYVVAALTHPGDSYQDQSATGSRMNLVNRPRHLHALLDYMLASWPHHDRLDPARVGAFGFSLGGFTALVAIGGNPDFRQIPKLCHEQPSAPECGFIAQHHSNQLDSTAAPADGWQHDPRIRAAVIAAPAVAVTFRDGGLSGVRVPVQLWRAENDTNAPDAWNSGVVRVGLPRPPEEHVVPHAGHLVFTVFCGDACVDWTAPVLAFFDAHLTSR
jgi:predicted dienelactone hydrolase